MGLPVGPCAVGLTGGRHYLLWALGPLCGPALQDYSACAFAVLPQLDLLGLPGWLSLTSGLIEVFCLSPAWAVALWC